VNHSPEKPGFTLIEILIAVAIIVAIVSMVYGSYFATSKSAQIYQARIALSGQIRDALSQIAQQIRCAYAGSSQPQGAPPTQDEKLVAENKISYFNGNPDNPNGEVLYLITTSKILGSKLAREGLFEVTYKFDNSTATILRSQRKFVDTLKNTVRKKNWQPVISNVSRLELIFFDGHQWLSKWDFDKMGKLPNAVKISIACKNEHNQQHHYETAAYICCQKNQSKQIKSETWVTVSR